MVRRIGLGATLTFLGLTGPKIAKIFSALRAEMPSESFKNSIKMRNFSRRFAPKCLQNRSKTALKTEKFSRRFAPKCPLEWFKNGISRVNKHLQIAKIFSALRAELLSLRKGLADRSRSYTNFSRVNDEKVCVARRPIGQSH